MVKNQFNTNIVEWMSDAGGEYKSKAFLDMLGNEGIKVSQSIPYIHQQTGRAERLIRTLTEKAETMRFQACLPPSWWEFSLDHAVRVYNRTPMRCLEWRTPHEWFTGERPSIKRLRVLGCGAYVFIPSEIRENKMAPKAELMIFLGMHSGGKGYIFMHGPNNIIFSAAHATFDESLFPRCPKRTLQNNTRLQEVAPPVAPCGGDNCHCPPPGMEDDDDTSHLFSRTSKKVISEAQKELDQRLRDVGVTPSQQHGMRMPPPHTSASQDRPPTPENIQHKQMQLDQPPNEPGPSKPPQRKRQPAALPLLEKNPPERKLFLNSTPRVMSTGRNILLRLRKTSSVKGIGKKLLARSPVVLADRTFPGESLSPIQFPTTVVMRKEETATSQMTLKMRPARCLGLPLPPRRKGLSSPDSPGKGESISCHSLFPKLFQSARRRNQRSGPIKT